MADAIIEVDASPETGLIVEVSAGDPPVIEVDAGGGGVTAHSALTGLDGDDHTQYALADGSRGDFEASGAVNAHNLATTSVHGIPDTADLITEGDPRLTDSRTPELHATTHAAAAADPITIDASQVSDFDDAATDGVAGNLIAGSSRVTIDHDDVGHTITLDSPEAVEVAVNDTNFTITDEQLIRIVAITGDLTIDLPDAGTLPAGWSIRVVDESGDAFDTGDTGQTSRVVTVQALPANSIGNPTDQGEATMAFIKSPFGALQFMSDGASKWTVINTGTRTPYVWWRHLNELAVVPDVWTPVVWNEVPTDDFRISPGLQSITTAVAASMDTLTLPRATIEVDSIDGFPDDGWIVITGPPGAGVDTVVRYTGLQASPPAFTGANLTGYPTGTLATGQTVTAANVMFDLSERGYLWNTIASIAMDNIDTGEWFAIRFVQFDGAFTVPGSTAHHPGLNIAAQHGQCVMQPGSDPGVLTRIEVRHSCPTVRNVVPDGIQSPILMGAFMSTF